MPREEPVHKTVSCTISTDYTVERDQDTGWLTIFLEGNGARRNLAPTTAELLRKFLMSRSKEQVRSEVLNSGFATQYTARYEYGYLTLELGSERLEFSVRSTRLLREFLEKELKKESKDNSEETSQ
jgi:hypothetical protein